MSPVVQPSGPPNTVQPNAWVNAEDPQRFVGLEMVEGATQIFPYASLIPYIFIPPPPKTWINFHHQQIMSSFILLINDDSKTIPCLPKLFFLIVQPMLLNLGLGHRLVLSDAVRSAENHTAPRSSTITTTTWNLKECYIMLHQCHNYTKNISEQVDENSAWSSIHHCHCPCFEILFGVALDVEQSDGDSNILQIFQGSKIKMYWKVSIKSIIIYIYIINAIYTVNNKHYKTLIKHITTKNHCKFM